MLNIILPHGSRRRAYTKDFFLRAKRNRFRRFHQREYNNYRQEYYRTANRLFIDDNGPLVSIIVPCWNTPQRYLQPLIDSVFAQGYQNWELVLVDASTDKDASDSIKNAASHDVRITYKKLNTNEGIAKNTNEGIKTAKGEYIAFLDHDDTLDPDALAYSVKAIMEHDAELVYSDEDKISDDGHRYFDPHFKPDYSPSMLRCVNYITHFVVVKKSVAEKVGYIEQGFDGAQDYNFLLNVVDVTDKIYHVPRILYHWREAVNSTASDFSNKSHVTDAGVKAIKNHLDRHKVSGRPRAIDNRPGFYEIVYKLVDAKRAVVIDIPSCNEKEIQFIKDAYENHDDVKENNINVVLRGISDLPDGEYNEILYVNKPVVPKNSDDHSINKLFGSLHSGALLTSPKKVSRGKIADCGLVSYRGSLVPLFYGTDITSYHYFGTHEWNREVNALEWGAICGSLKDIKANIGHDIITGKNLVIIGQTEYEIFDEANHHDTGIKNGIDYFNKNLETEIYPRIIKSEPLREKVPIGK